MAEPWLEGLTTAQREAATYGSGPLLIVAGAGTGKTRTLVSRVAHLINAGVAPDRILLLTFTRRSAAEMIGRVKRLLPQLSGAGVWGGTFHAAANRLLRIYGDAMGLPGDFTVMDEQDAGGLMGLVRAELGFASRKKRFVGRQSLAKIHSHTVNAQRPLDDTLARYFPWCADDRDAIARIFDAYVERKQTQHLLDYDDLLLFWGALCDVPRVGAKVAGRFEHILVDEYQDTNPLQADILRGMRRTITNLSVVGDDAQSIYSFRAATVRNILDFPQIFTPAHVVTLERNYRSTAGILAASNVVMAQAKEQYTKELYTERGGGARPVLTTCRDEEEQTDLVVSYILEHLETGTPLNRQAVLFRTGHHSALLEVALARRNIPFHKYGGLKFIEAAHIKDVLAVLRVLENPYDELSWFRILQMFDGIGAKSAQRVMVDLGVRGSAVTNGATPVLKLISEAPAVPTAAKGDFDRFRRMVAHCVGCPQPAGEASTEDGAGATPSEPALTVQLDLVRTFYAPLVTRLYDNAPARERDLEHLTQIAARYRSRASLITDLTLDPPNATADLAQPPYLEEDFLILSTIHSAKGCEWDVVHIIHAADGMIPSDMAVTDEAGVEEERRLLYVAMTRAKDHLYIYFPLRYYHSRFRRGDRHTYAQRSRYLTNDVVAMLDQQTTEGVAAGVDTRSRERGIASDPRARARRLWST